MPWDNPNSTDNLTDTKPGSLLDSCRRAIYERLKAIYFKSNYHFAIDVDVVPSNPRYFSSLNSIYDLMLEPPTFSTNLFHTFFKRSIPHIIHSFSDPVSTYLPDVNHLQHVARYEWIDGLSPANEKWANMLLFSRESNGTPWVIVDDSSAIIEEFYRRNPYFIPLLGKPQQGDYVLPLWRRLYNITLAMADKFIDLTDFFTNGGTAYDLINAKTVLQQYGANNLKYRAPFEIDIDKFGPGTLAVLPAGINRIFSGMVARERKTGKYYQYRGSDKEAGSSGGLSFFRSEFIEINGAGRSNPSTITELHMRYPDNPFVAIPARYDPSEQGAYAGLHIAQDIVTLLKKMRYLKEDTDIAGHITGYIKGVIRDNSGQTNFDNPINSDFDTRTGQQGNSSYQPNIMNPGSWVRAKINDSQSSPGSILVRAYEYWVTAGGSYYVDDRTTFVPVPMTPHVYVSPFERYLDGTQTSTPFVMDVAGQTFAQPPEPADFPWDVGQRSIAGGYNIVQGVSEWNFQYN